MGTLYDYSATTLGGKPLFKWLKSEKPGFLGTQAIKWSFTKFLVGRDGRPVGRYATVTKPQSLAGDIEKYS